MTQGRKGRCWELEQQLFLVNTKIEADMAKARLAEFRHSVRPLVQHADQQAATARSKAFLREAVGLLVDAGEFPIEKSESALNLTELCSKTMGSRNSN